MLCACACNSRHLLLEAQIPKVQCTQIIPSVNLAHASVRIQKQKIMRMIESKTMRCESQGSGPTEPDFAQSQDCDGLRALTMLTEVRRSCDAIVPKDMESADSGVPSYASGLQADEALCVLCG